MVQKKLTALVLALALTLVLTACGSSKNNSNHHRTLNPMSHGADRWADASVSFGGTWDYTGGTLQLTGVTASDNLVCDGLQPTDVNTFAVTTLNADTMIFFDNSYEVYKCQGTCDDVTGVGTWKMIPKDRPWEKHILILNDDGTFSAKIFGLNCANSYSYYTCKDGRYYLDIWVDDPDDILTSVSFSGPETLIGSTIDLGWCGFGWCYYGTQLLATPDAIETFKFTIVEGTTTRTIIDRQKFYNDCAGCLSPMSGEHLSGDTVTFVWGGVTYNPNFVDYDIEFSGQGMSGDTVIFNRNTHSVTFPDDDTNSNAWGHWDVYSEYYSGDTDQSCGGFHTN